MYRLLFLFYIEARPELGYAPLNSDAYRAGYSLERLRDLELVELVDGRIAQPFPLSREYPDSFSPHPRWV